MIGKQTAIYDMGVRKVATLREDAFEILVAHFGKNGISLWNKAHGVDNSPIVSLASKINFHGEVLFDQDSIDVRKSGIINFNRHD